MRRSRAKPPKASSLVVALGFLAATLVPGLLPRPWYVQGALSGVALAVGLGLGSASSAIAHRLLSRRVIDQRWAILARRTGLVLAAAVVVWAGFIHWRWQDDVRRLMGMEPGTLDYLGGVAAIAPVVAIFFVLVGRAVAAVFRLIHRRLRRWLSTGASTAIVTVLAFLSVVVFFDQVVAGLAVPALEAAHHRSDTGFDPDVARPVSPMRSGSAQSLIDWETMGRQGREFVALAPSLEQIETFSDAPATDPVRIYVGLRSADGAEARARLALAEMERTGAFSRRLIVLVAPTGSGWIDPYAVTPLEYMNDGDTAAVAVQYSYVASWLVMVRNQDLATDATRALFRLVSRRLAEEPEETRPRLLLYGESLGAFGWERTFVDLDEVVASADGVLWVGPPRVNPIWRRLVAARDPSSPLWRPVYGDGTTVRFGPDADSLRAPDGPWNPPRIVYLQHASDPITYLSNDVFVERPDWLDAPRGPDVSRHMPYIPVVTWTQMALDLILGSNAPLGHGHKFGATQAEAWVLITAPEGWTESDTDRLIRTLSR